MSREQQAKALKEKIFRSFAETSRPISSSLVTHDCWECEQLQKTFAGLDWRNVPPEIIEANNDQLPLFSPEAFNYFLPAYLLYSLNNFDPTSPVLELTVYTLTPDASENCASLWKDRIKLFTAGQMECIYEFLDFVRQDPEAYSFYVLIDRGKKRLAALAENQLKN